MKRVDLIPLIKEKGISSKNLTNVIVEEVLRFEALNRDNVDVKVLSQTVSTFLNKVKEKLSKYNRMYERFLIKEDTWLQENVNVKLLNVPQSSSGRPRKSWEELGENAQNRPECRMRRRVQASR